MFAKKKSVVFRVYSCLLIIFNLTFVSLKSQFEQNEGQVESSEGEQQRDFQYTYQPNNPKLIFFKNKITYVLFNTSDVETDESIKAKKGVDTKKAKNLSLRIKQQHIEFNFLNSNSNSDVISEDKISSLHSFHLKYCTKEITNVQRYSTITYKNKYYKNEIIFVSTKKEVNYDIILWLGVDINYVQFGYKDVKKYSVLKNGIVFETEILSLEESVSLPFPLEIYFTQFDSDYFYILDFGENSEVFKRFTLSTESKDPSNLLAIVSSSSN